MKKNIYVMLVLCLIMILFVVSCITHPLPKPTPKPDIVVVETVEPKNKDIYSFGSDKEVQIYILDDKVYYLLGIDKDIKYVSSNDLQIFAINTNTVNVSEVSIDGIDGIILSYYDIKIFLEQTKQLGSTRVGVFEPKSNSWSIGYDKNRDNNAIEFPYSNQNIGPVVINISSISRAYN